MSGNRYNPYDIEAHVAEVYDQVETQSDDISFLRGLIGSGPRLRILEPFSGTGRILIPLACDGHRLTGMDQSGRMLDRARAKIAALPGEVRGRIALLEQDATAAGWPAGFDLVVLAGNCLYELAEAGEQQQVIAFAAAALNPDGYLFLDNDHMEGCLDEAWRERGARIGFPTGVCADGTSLESSLETVWCDAAARLVRFRRWTKAILPDGRSETVEFIQQKHPVSAAEVRSWLEAAGMSITLECGDYARNPIATDSERAIFWARKGG